MKPILAVCSILCLVFSCSKAPQDDREIEALRQENAALEAKNKELSSKLTALIQKDTSNANVKSVEEINSERPYSFREIVSYADASGEYTIYFILADKNDRPTTFDGKVQLTIKGPLDVYKKDYNVSKSDFKIITRGRGALEERILACVLPRVSKHEFIFDPVQKYGETSGKIYMQLSGGSLWIPGEGSIFFK